MEIGIGSRVRRIRGQATVGTVIRIFTVSRYDGSHARRVARVAWPCNRLGGGDNLIHSSVRLDGLCLVDVAGDQR